MKNLKSPDQFDSLETLLAYAISTEGWRSDKKEITDKIGRSNRVSFDPSGEMPFNDDYPSCFYIMDMFDSGRLYSERSSDLIKKPQEWIGRGCEIMILDQTTNSMKWAKLRRTGKIPKTVSFMRRPKVIYEVHFRQVFVNDITHYTKTYMGIDADGKVIPCSIFGHKASIEKDQSMINLSASIIEDCFRSQSVRATISNESSGMTAITPMPKESYYEALRLRDGPTSRKGNKRPILHWVGQFVRKYNSGKVVKVSEHTRGVDFVKVGDMSIKLEPQ